MLKTVQLATKPKRAAPKSKYIDPIVQATFGNGLQEVVRGLDTRLRDDNPTVVLKALIVTHTIMRSGSLDSTLSYLVNANPLTSGRYGSPNAAAYGTYLAARIKSYGNLKRDIIRDKSDRRAQNRLRSLAVEQGLLREVRETQRMIATLVEAKFYLDDIDDDVAMTALRILVKDLLVLFTAVNEGVINVLEHYFEMSHVDATTALKIYKTFCRDTEKVVAYLGVAKKLNNILNVPIPNLKHAPVSLVGSLEEYLNDPNFAANREEYKENKRIADGGTPAPKKVTAASIPPSSSTSAPSAASSSSAATNATPAASKPAQNFTDFFESIEAAQTPMFNPSTGSPSSQYFQQQAAFNPFLQAQPTGFAPPFQPQQLVPQMTGINPFGVFGAPGGSGGRPMSMFPAPQMQQQTGFGGLQPQLTGGPNPFRQSMMMTGMPASPSPFGAAPQPQMTGFTGGGGGPFGQPQQLQPMMTGNPFQPQQMAPQQTGNPFGAPLQSAPFGRQQSGSFSSSPFGVPPPQQQQQQNGSFSSVPPPPPQTSSAASPFGLTQRTASPSPFGNGASAAPLVAQKTGTKNPFNPSPEEARERDERLRKEREREMQGPSMNALAWGGAAPSQGQGQGQGQGGQQQQQQPLTQTKTGLMGDLASEFAFGSSGGGSTSMNGAPNGSGGANANGNGNGTTAFSPPSQFVPAPLLSQPTGPAGSTVKPFQPTSAFGTGSPLPPPSSSSSSSTPFPSSSAFSTSSSPNPFPSSPAPIQSQPTGFGGSTMKAFQPTSSFGSKLVDEFGAPPASSAATTSAFSSNTFPSSFSNGIGNGSGNGNGFSSSPASQQAASLSSQTTGFNPFRGTTLPPLNSSLSQGMNGSPFGQQQQNGVGGGMGSLI